MVKVVIQLYRVCLLVSLRVRIRLEWVYEVSVRWVYKVRCMWGV